MCTPLILLMVVGVWIIGSGSEDVLHAITQLSQPIPGQGPEQNQRFVAVLLDGLRYRAKRPPPVPNPAG
jgi:hypothetical protein